MLIQISSEEKNMFQSFVYNIIYELNTNTCA